MSTFNLNEKVAGSAVFNNGVAGKAVGVNVQLKKEKLMNQIVIQIIN